MIDRNLAAACFGCGLGGLLFGFAMLNADWIAFAIGLANLAASGLNIYIVHRALNNQSSTKKENP